MSDQEEKPAKRGEAAWTAALDEVSQRNARARKAGKQEREAQEAERGKARRAAEKRRMADLVRGRAGR